MRNLAWSISKEANQENEMVSRNEGCIIFLKQHLTGIKILQQVLIATFCTGLLLFQGWKCVDKFLSKKTGTADKYVHVSDTYIPELTICPTYPYKLDVLTANGITTTSQMQFGANWISNDSQKSAEYFYNETVLDIKDLLSSAILYVGGKKNIIRLTSNDTVCNGQSWYQIKPYYYNGNCWGLVMPDCVRKAGIIEYTFNFLNKTDIFIHHSGQFLNPNSKSRVDVELGGFTKIAISHEVVQLISGTHYT